jgi:predicted metal-binding membrane protein
MGRCNGGSRRRNGVQFRLERQIQQAHSVFVEQRLTAPGRASVAAWVVFLCIAAIAWAIAVVQSDGMAMPAMMPLPVFLAFWIVMMIAMMFPSVAPTAILWSSAIAKSSSGIERALRMTQFIGGYLLAWTAFGAAVYWIVVELAALLGRSPQSAGWIGAAIFLFAAAYQLTPLKRTCLLHCRSPFAALMHYARFPQRGRDVLVGLHHGTFCVGCCWGLMALLLAAGLMNLAAMAAVAALIFLEKRWRHGAALAAYASVGFLVLAALAALRPNLFPGLH